tara:strand:+ start:515 stop:1075 length:561 start_codon:yes stop_codon:yes gene_type:complete
MAKVRINESSLRKIIRNVIQELTGLNVGLGGAKPRGYKSVATKSAKKAYDTSDSEYSKKSSDYLSKKDVYDKVNLAKKYRKAQRGGGYLYTSDVTTAKRGGYTENPEWTSADSDLRTASGDRDKAKADRSSKQVTYKTSIDTDVAKTKAQTTAKPPVASSAAWASGKGITGKGKGRGKGKGKKKQN